MEEAEVTEQVDTEREQQAAQRARTRASAARWDLDIAVFLLSLFYCFRTSELRWWHQLPSSA